MFNPTVGSTVYSEPKPPSYDSQYDVPPKHHAVPEPSLYNVPPTANQPLNTRTPEAAAPPRPSSGGAQNGDQHRVDAFDMGECSLLHCQFPSLDAEIVLTA